MASGFRGIEDGEWAAFSGATDADQAAATVVPGSGGVVWDGRGRGVFGRPRTKDGR